jgi:hypothetical protein
LRITSRQTGGDGGGVLAMRVYGYLQDQHSVPMAKKVTFSKQQPENVMPMPDQKAG